MLLSHCTAWMLTKKWFILKLVPHFYISLSTKPDKMQLHYSPREGSVLLKFLFVEINKTTSNKNDHPYPPCFSVPKNSCFTKSKLTCVCHLLSTCTGEQPGKDLGRASSDEMFDWFRQFKEILNYQTLHFSLSAVDSQNHQAGHVARMTSERREKEVGLSWNW